MVGVQVLPWGHGASLPTVQGVTDGSGGVVKHTPWHGRLVRQGSVGVQNQEVGQGPFCAWDSVDGRLTY